MQIDTHMPIWMMMVICRSSCVYQYWWWWCNTIAFYDSRPWFYWYVVTLSLTMSPPKGMNALVESVNYLQKAGGGGYKARRQMKQWWYENMWATWIAIYGLYLFSVFRLRKVHGFYRFGWLVSALFICDLLWIIWNTGGEQNYQLTTDLFYYWIILHIILIFEYL